MSTSISQINALIQWYLKTPADERLNGLIKSSPVDLDKGTRDRGALRRVYKKLETIEGCRNALLEEFANDLWETGQLDLFENPGTWLDEEKE